jgi:hypothetical protein
MSPEGLTLYGSAQDDAGVAWFDRDPLTGQLTFGGCVSGEAATAGTCTTIPSATANGDNSGLSNLETIAMSSDGASIYGVSQDDDAVSHFDRERDLDPPETTLTKKPKKRTKKRRARFAFTADEPLATFECRLDKKVFASCESPLRTKKLKRRKHKFLVRAIDTAGNVDPAPAKRKWKVKKKRRR